MMAGPGFAHGIAGGNGKLAIPALQSPNFIHTIQGWSINQDGSAEFHDVIIPDTGGTVVTFASTAPASPNTGDVWYDTADGLLAQQWNGTAWVAYQIGAGAIATGTIIAGVVDGTTITGGTIVGSVFKGTNWIENSAGQFMYGGTPAAGNMLLSVAPSAGSDAYGNAFEPGVWVYFNGDKIDLLNQGSAAALLLLPTSTTLSIGPQLFGFLENSGLATEQAALTITSGKESGNADAAIGLVSASSDNTVPARMTIEFGGAIWGNIGLATGLIVDSWHNITLDSGWTAGAQVPQYRLLPDGNVQVRGQATHAGITAATNINGSTPIPAAYRPAQTRIYRPPDAGDAAATVDITTTGVFVARASGFTATAILLDGMYSL